MTKRYWKISTRIWLFCTFGWAFITLASGIQEAVIVLLGCLAATLLSNWRYKNARS